MTIKGLLNKRLDPWTNMVVTVGIFLALLPLAVFLANFLKQF